MGRNHALGATAFYVYLHPGISLKHIEGTGFGPKKNGISKTWDRKENIEGVKEIPAHVSSCEGDMYTPFSSNILNPKNVDVDTRIFLFKIFDFPVPAILPTHLIPKRLKVPIPMFKEDCNKHIYFW